MVPIPTLCEESTLLPLDLNVMFQISSRRSGHLEGTMQQKVDKILLIVSRTKAKRASNHTGTREGVNDFLPNQSCIRSCVLEWFPRFYFTRGVNEVDLIPLPLGQFLRAAIKLMTQTFSQAKKQRSLTKHDEKVCNLVSNV